MATSKVQVDPVQTMPDDQAAELARLEARAAEGDAAQSAPVAGAQVQAEPGPVVSTEEMLLGALSVVAMVANTAGYKRAASIWSQDACRELANRAVPVLRKYPWGVRVIAFLESGAGVEEIALVVYAAPLVLATVGAARLDAEAMRKVVEPASDEAAKQTDAEAVRRGLGG